MICGCVGVRECGYVYRVIVFIRNYEFYSFVYNLYYFFVSRPISLALDTAAFSGYCIRR